MTEKLYDLNSYLTEFDAVVLACRPVEAACFKDTVKAITRNEKNQTAFYELVLDRTAFFPEGGGQSSDTGEINGFPVYDVRNVHDEIVHLIGVPASEQNISFNNDADSEILLDQQNMTGPFRPNTSVHGKINWAKRYERMQQHSGEHLLSGFVFKQFGYHNTGFHLSDNGTTVDFDGTFTDEDLILIENTVNEIISKNVPSHIYFPSSDELKALTYRSKKELEGPVRIVEFAGPQDSDVMQTSDGLAVNQPVIYDRCACCAPHVASTIEIGLFKILSAEHFKGGTRMEIACGQRLLSEMRTMQNNIRTISQLLSVKPENTAEGVSKLNEAYKILKFNNVRIERELLEMTAAHAEKPILFLDSADTGNVRIAVNSLIARFPDSYCSAFVGNDEKGYNFIIGCTPNSEPSTLDCTKLLASLKSELKASGGGSSSMIQGNVKATKDAIITFLSHDF